MEKLRKNPQKFILITLLELITVDEMGVDELGVDEMGVDEMGSRRSGNKPSVSYPSMTEQVGLCTTWFELPKTGFLKVRLNSPAVEIRCVSDDI